MFVLKTKSIASVVPTKFVHAVVPVLPVSHHQPIPYFGAPVVVSNPITACPVGATQYPPRKLASLDPIERQLVFKKFASAVFENHTSISFHVHGLLAIFSKYVAKSHCALELPSGDKLGAAKTEIVQKSIEKSTRPRYFFIPFKKKRYEQICTYLHSST